MSVIGNFKKVGSDYVGEILTRQIQESNVRIARDDTRTHEDAPTHRVLLGRAEIGAGWTKKRRDGAGDYLSIKLDDPSFSQPIFASLWPDDIEGDFKLLWSRTRDNS